MAEKQGKKQFNHQEYIYSVLIAVALALIIRTGVVQAFYIPSGSMEDTLLVGDYLLANKFIYGAPIDVPFTNITLFRLPALRDPVPGEILIFRSPVNPDLDLIKRCVAAGGQTVEVIDKVLYVDGRRLEDPPHSKYEDRTIYPADRYPRDNFGPYQVPADHFFMMGDNRDNSADSRNWLSVSRELIKGKAMIIYWSWPDGPYHSEAGSLPGIVANYLGRLPTRIFNTRYARLGNVIH